MKKSILFFTVALCTTLMFSCTSDEIEQNNPTQNIDVEKRANNGGNQGLGSEIPKEK